MSQTDLFPADPPARGIDHGGYMPGQKITWRGYQIPESYLFDWGFGTERRPTDIALMNRVVEALSNRSASFRQLMEAVSSSAFELSKHLNLMRDLEVVRYGLWITEEHSHEIMLNIEGVSQ